MGFDAFEGISENLEWQSKARERISKLCNRLSVFGVEYWKYMLLLRNYEARLI